MAEKKKSKKKKKKIYKEDAIEERIAKGKKGIYYAAPNIYVTQVSEFIF